MISTIFQSLELFFLQGTPPTVVCFIENTQNQPVARYRKKSLVSQSIQNASTCRKMRQDVVATPFRVIWWHFEAFLGISGYFASILKQVIFFDIWQVADFVYFL